MGKYTPEIIGLTAEKVLLSIFSLAIPFFEADRIYRTSARKFREENSDRADEINERIKYLKRHGLIEHFVEGKEKFLELTPKGLAKIKKANINVIAINRPAIWDRKWRVVIFDIPEKHKTSRDVLRAKLIELGFEKIQESVYVHPFECTEEITQISQMISETKSILIMISEIIQGEDDLIERFLDTGTLTVKDIKESIKASNL